MGLETRNIKKKKKNLRGDIEPKNKTVLEQIISTTFSDLCDISTAGLWRVKCSASREASRSNYTDGKIEGMAFVE